MRVVCAAIFDKGELLAARRMSPAELAGKFELPGGKVEEGEDPRSALAREIREELGVDVDIDEEPFGTWKFQHRLKSRTFVFYRARLTGPRPLRSTDHDQLVWLPRESWVLGVDWIDVDREAILTLAWPPENSPGL